METAEGSLRPVKSGRLPRLAWCLLAVAMCAGWGVDHWLCTTVTPLSGWQEWPDPFSSMSASGGAPACTNVIARGSPEACYLEKVRKAMVEAEEIALQMVCEYRRQAVEGVRCGARPASYRAESRLVALRDSLAWGDCPTQCVPVAAAVRLTLVEAARFYRVSGHGGRGFSRGALVRARRAAEAQAALFAGYRVEPEVPADLIHAVLTNDCVTLAHAVDAELRARYVGEGGDWFIQRSGADEDEMTPERKFYQANQESRYPRALWQVLSGDGYSPFLASAFLYWRSDVQAYYFGMSDGSEIPNEQYNRVRFMALERVDEFLKDNPGNLHAQAQKEVLLGVPNIRRIMPYGNTCQFGGVWL